MALEEERRHTGGTGRLGPLVYIICNQTDTAPAWGYILRQKGLTVVMETVLDQAVEHWSDALPDVTVVDVDAPQADRVELCRRLRSVSGGPLLLFLPAHHETEILEAYAAGVDDCVIKPVSPAIFLAKVMAWAQRSWTVPVEGIHPIQTASWKLDPASRSLVHKDKVQVPLTNLEFRLLNLLMSKPGMVFSNQELVRVVWGNYGHGDEVLLKNVVYRLRKKLAACGDSSHPLRTWQGGYSFNESTRFS
jgi:DNA-binding response OmpR family regulator